MTDDEILSPKYDTNGLLTAIVTHAETGAVLMLAHMNAEALTETLATGYAHFYSRSRAKQWMKGEESGNVLRVQEILIDCDQDAVLLKCHPAGPTCHTGVTSCFYRRLNADKTLTNI